MLKCFYASDQRDCFLFRMEMTATAMDESFDETFIMTAQREKTIFLHTDG